MPKLGWHWSSIRNLAAVLLFLDMTTVSYSLFVVAHPFFNSVLVLSVLYLNMKDFSAMFIQPLVTASSGNWNTCASQYFNFYLYPYVELNVDDHKKESDENKGISLPHNRFQRESEGP